jgi:hypothetical protein
VQPASHGGDGVDQVIAESLDQLSQRPNLQQLVDCRQVSVELQLLAART